MRRALVLLAVLGCNQQASRELDHDLIDVSLDAKLRTDTVGAGQFEDHSTFVLVDAKNRATEGAYITLSGELADGTGTVVGELRAQSLWIPAGEVRTFALVDRERKPRPTAAAARIHLRGANVPASPPSSYVDGIHERVDNGRVVVQGTLHNDATRAAQIMVIASFHDDTNHPMTRPFAMEQLQPHTTAMVQFVGPEGSKRGTIYAGDSVY